MATSGAANTVPNSNQPAEAVSFHSSAPRLPELLAARRTVGVSPCIGEEAVPFCPRRPHSRDRAASRFGARAGRKPTHWLRRERLSYSMRAKRPAPGQLKSPPRNANRCRINHSPWQPLGLPTLFQTPTNRLKPFLFIPPHRVRWSYWPREGPLMFPLTSGRKRFPFTPAVRTAVTVRLQALE